MHIAFHVNRLGAESRVPIPRVLRAGGDLLAFVQPLLAHLNLESKLIPGLYSSLTASFLRQEMNDGEDTYWIVTSRAGFQAC